MDVQTYSEKAYEVRIAREYDTWIASNPAAKNAVDAVVLGSPEEALVWATLATAFEIRKTRVGG